MNKQDVIIIGAGAAGLMCAIEAGKRGRKVTVIEGSNKPGKKILMSGGGRCNFTNYHIEPEKYISQNPHFCKSALSQYTQWDFIALVEKHGIEYYEKTLGQLFCVHKSRDILAMLLKECELVGVKIVRQTKVEQLKQVKDHHFTVKTQDTTYHTESVIIASGGLSIPTLGSSPFGYQMAEQFGLSVVKTRAGLVPFTLAKKQLARYQDLPGVALPVSISNQQTQFKEGMLFTHKGLSGPSVLQISSYWQPGESININMFPDVDLEQLLIQRQKESPDRLLKTELGNHLPKKLVQVLLNPTYAERKLKQLAPHDIQAIVADLCDWRVYPNGTEGYKTAEVTLGGVNVDQLSSKTMECHSVKGLYFVGEVVDVTGWLGGYNFQWAWSSGWVAGQYA